MSLRLPRIVLVLSLFALGVPRAMGQILTNGGFESGLAGWSTRLSGGGSASFTTINSLVRSGKSALKICVTSAGTLPNSVQLTHTSFVASRTNTYVLRFWASSDVDFANLSVALQGASPEFPPIPFKISTNASSYQEYFYPFRAAGHVSVGFNFQTSSNNYLISTTWKCST